MATRFQQRLNALLNDLRAEIELDSRKQMVAEQEALEAGNRIRANTELLRSVKARLNGQSLNGVDDSPATPPPKQRRTRKIGERKIDKVLTAISNMTKPEFTPADILAEINRLYPDAGITRAHLSSLMWKLSTLPEGRSRFKQTAKWTGGANPARYAKIEEVRTRTRGTTPAVPQADIFEDLTVGENGK